MAHKVICTINSNINLQRGKRVTKSDIFVFFQCSCVYDTNSSSPSMELHSLPSGKNMTLTEVGACSFMGEVEKTECGSLRPSDDYQGTFS